MRTSTLLGKMRSGVVLGAFLALCIMVFATGCKKEPVTPDPKEETAVIKSSAVPANPSYGGSTTVTYNVEGTCGKFFAIYKGDTVAKVCNGSFTLTNLTESGYIFFTCILEKSGRIINGSLPIPVGNAPTPPVLTVTYDTSTVPYLGSKVIQWSSSTNTDSVVDSKNHNVGKSGSIQLGGLTKDTIIVRKAINTAGFDAKTIHIKVSPKPTLTTYQIFTQPQGGWQHVAKYREFPSGERDTVTNISNGDWLYKYGTDGICNIYRISTGAHIGNPPWNLLPGEHQFTIDVIVNSIDSISQNKMTYRVQENCYGCTQGSTYIATYEDIFKVN